MAELALVAKLGHDSSRISSADNDSGTLLDSLDGRIEKSLGTLCELGELEYTRRSRALGYQLFMDDKDLPYPFQRIVLASSTVCLYSSRLFGPASRPCQPSGIPCSSVATPV